ncbi:MAG: 4Fe-4S binding protein [Clostridia bacterium]|nr:4Fe-4S binding protein [Clostridia bacterium]
MKSAFDFGTVGKCPKVGYIVQFDESKCLKCGLCVKRCQFDVF